MKKNIMALAMNLKESKLLQRATQNGLKEYLLLNPWVISREKKTVLKKITKIEELLNKSKTKLLNTSEEALKK